MKFTRLPILLIIGFTALRASALPQSQAVGAGGATTLVTTAAGTVRWSHNGTQVAGANSGSLTLSNVQPASAGIYTATITNGATTTTESAIVGVATTGKVVGTASEVSPNVTHPNGNVYDQILLQGAAATITADPGQVTRISFIDLSDDIVQVEFSGAGTLSLVLEAPTGPAAPANYHQAVTYMRGHASIVITGADETSNVSVFSVGRGNAVNQALFKDSVTYDGVADLAVIAIQSPTGRFGGVRTANASYWNSKGFTGVYAPGVALAGPLYVGEITAADTASPVLLVGSVADARITGGDLSQTNGSAVQVSGLTQLQFTAGSTSHHGVLAARTNLGRLEQDGLDVTTQLAPGSASGGSTGGKELTFASAQAAAPYANGAKKPFTASLTSLQFDGKTLTNPTALTSLSAPYAGARFTDAATGLVWEVIFKDGVIYEINLMQGSTFLGQWS